MSRQLPSPSVGLRAVGRQIISQPAVMLSVGAVVLVAALGLSALPRSLELASREDLRRTLTEAQPAPRNLAIFHESFHLPGREDMLSSARERGDSFVTDDLSRRIQGLIRSRDMVIDSPQFFVETLPGSPERVTAPIYIDLRLQDAVGDQSEVTKGRLPSPAEPIEVQFECPPEAPECPPVRLPVIEVALTEEMATETVLTVGDRVLLLPDSRDPAWEEVPLRRIEQTRLVLEVTGIIELSDPELDDWFGDRKLHFPRKVFLDLDTQWTEGTALMSPDAYGEALRALGGTGPPWWRYEWRYFVDPDGVARADIGAISRDLARLRLANATAPAGSNAVFVSTGLPELIDTHLAQRAQTLRVMALVVAGIVATVAVALLALGVLTTERQRDQIILARDRGTSAPQVLTSRLYQALFMTLVPLTAAYLAVAALFPDTSGRTPYVLAVALATVATMALMAPVWWLARRPLGNLRSEGTWPPTPNPRRVVFELLLFLVAAACVLLVRRRDPRETGFDWLLVATPAVVGAAVGAIAIRLAGPVAFSLSSFASRSRGAVSFLALRRVVQQPASTRTPLAVLVVCMAAASMSVVMLRSIENGQQSSSWHTVGADFTITSSAPLPGGASDGIDGESVEAAVFTSRSRVENQRSNADVFAVDAARHDEVFGDTPGAAGFAALATRTASGAIPAIVSESWTSRIRTFVGQKLTIPVGDVEVDLEIVGLRAEYPGLRPPFVVVDRGSIEEAAEVSLAATTVLVRGPQALESEIALLADEAGASFASRYEVLGDLAEDPMVSWTVQGLSTGGLMAAAVGALSIVAALALESARRRRDLGYLKTMGLETGGATAITLIEQIPGVALATALGLVTGTTTLVAIRPSLDLGVLTGERFTPIAIDWGLLGSVFGLALLLLAAAGVIFVLVNRRQDLGRAVRVGDR